MDISTLMKQVDSYTNEFTAFRRDFHKHAEVAWTEFRTTSKIIEFLQERNIPVQFGLDVINPEYTWSYPNQEILEKCQKRAIQEGANPDLVARMNGYTGAMALIDSGKPGPTYVFRFDIDCNDIDEAKENSHRPYAEGFSSIHENCMHACGHDGHATMGMILAAVLYENRAQLLGKVKIIFQPSEEGDKGAQAVVMKGLLDDADMAFGMHLYPTDGPQPALAGTQKGLYATTKFDVTINGRSSHAGASPQTGNNAIMAAVMAISSMQSFLQDGRGPTRLNIGTISGGTGRNVIPGKCFFRAETRASDTDAEKRLFNSAIGCVKAACEAFGCTYDVKIMGSCPTGSGDEDLAAQIVEATSIVSDLKTRQLVLNNTGGTDDFAYMMEHLQNRGKKACYMALLTNITSDLHNNYYDFDESCLPAGVKSCLAILHYFYEKIESGK